RAFRCGFAGHWKRRWRRSWQAWLEHVWNHPGIAVSGRKRVKLWLEVAKTERIDPSRRTEVKERGKFMCDYSLMMIPNRLAIEGEELVAHRFQSGSLGLVSCFDYDRWLNQRPKSIWQRFKAWCSADNEPTPVVCIPPGARLRVDR